MASARTSYFPGAHVYYSYGTCGGARNTYDSWASSSTECSMWTSDRCPSDFWGFALTGLCPARLGRPLSDRLRVMTAMDQALGLVTTLENYVKSSADAIERAHAAYGAEVSPRTCESHNTCPTCEIRSLLPHFCLTFLTLKSLLRLFHLTFRTFLYSFPFKITDQMRLLRAPSWLDHEGWPHYGERALALR